MAVNVVTSFHESAVSANELNRIMADYLALERVRVFRRLLVTRCGILATVVAVAGLWLHWLPPFASWFTVTLFLVPPTWACVLEWTRRRRLAELLDEVPGAITKVANGPAA